MLIDNILLEIPTQIKNAQIIKEIILEKLVEEKLITSEQANNFDDEYQLIIFKRSWYSKWWNNVTKGTKEELENYQYKLVKF